jgi:hypothetical protein
MFFPILLALLVLGYVLNAQKIDNLLGSYAIEKLFDTVKEQQQSYLTAEDAEAGSVFNIGTIEPTLSGFLKKMPAGIVAALFRPFLWESRNFLMIFTAMESSCFFCYAVCVMENGICIFYQNNIPRQVCIPLYFLCADICCVGWIVYFQFRHIGQVSYTHHSVLPGGYRWNMVQVLC